MEKVSVIIPIYNVEEYLDRCVQSVCNQTYKNLEIILVDDGATDHSPEMCDKYSEMDKRIKVIHKQNGGLSSARNAGIEACTGEWLVFVDSDDYISPEMVECLYDAASKYNTDMAYCTLRGFTEDNNGYSEFRIWGDPPNTDVVISGLEILKESLEKNGGLLSGHHVIAVNKIYRKHLFDSIRYPVGLLHEDEAIAHHMLGQCDRIVGINRPLYYYRQRSGSITHSNNNILRIICLALIYGDRILFYEKNNISNSIDTLYDRYWQLLVNNYCDFDKDNDLVKKLEEQKNTVAEYYVKRENSSFLKRVCCRFFDKSPNGISKLYRDIARARRVIKRYITK